MISPKQQFVKIPKDIFDKVLAELQAIKQQGPDKSGGGDGYPYALGKCHGMAGSALIYLEVYGKEVR